MSSGRSPAQRSRGRTASSSRRATLRATYRSSQLRAERARLQEREAEVRVQQQEAARGKVRTTVEIWTIIIAALVGAISLGCTAVSTYMGVQVNQDQLKQSTEQDEDKEKDQASKVTYWLEDYKPDDPKMLGGGRNRLIIINRSFDPVKNAGFLYEVTERELRGDNNIHGLSVAGGSWISVIPPCSQITVESTSLLRADRSPVSEKAEMDVIEMTFDDAKGQTWHRVRGYLRKGKIENSSSFSTGIFDYGIIKTVNDKPYGNSDNRVGSMEQPAIINSAATAKPVEKCGTKD